MKKTAIALLTAATISTSALAAVSDAQFQWGGLIPPAEKIVPEVCIDNTGIVDHKNGVLEFTNDGENIRLVDASDLSFKVMDQNCDATAATPAKDIAYKYTLKTTAVSVGGITDTDSMSPLQTWLHVTADGTKLLHNVQSAVIAAGTSTTLSVAQNADLPSTDALYEQVDGQDILVLALVEVTNEI